LSWEAIGALGELIGALAVLITLIYLALQIRQNTRAVQLSAQDATKRNFSSFAHLLASSAEVADLFRKGCADYRALSATDRLRFANLLQDLLYTLATQQQQASQGLIAETGVSSRLSFLFSQPGVQDWWERNSQLFGPDFVAIVDGVIAESRVGVSLVDMRWV